MLESPQISSVTGRRLGAASRALAGAGLLLFEYGFVAVRFDGGVLMRRGGWLSQLNSAGEVFTALIVITTAALVLNAQALRAAFVASSVPTRIHIGWLGAHLAAFVAAVLATDTLFAAARSAAFSAALIAVAAACAGVSVLALLRALFDEHAAQLTRALLRAARAGAVLGAVAWLGGVQLRPLWPQLAQVTLLSAGSLLRTLSNDVTIDPPQAALGLGSFVVIIEAGCSGVEGMALVAVFLGGYVYHYRRELRLLRATALVALAVPLAWLTNVLRIAALIVVGARWSPAIAFGGFHSKAGWLLSCTLALSLVFALQRGAFFRRAPGAAGSEAHENPTAWFCLPFLVMTAASLFGGLWTTEDFDRFYGLKLVAALVTLLLVARTVRLRPLAALLEATRFSPWAVAAGSLVIALWLAWSPSDLPAARAAHAAWQALASWERWLWLALRLLGSVFVAPLVEELAFRGFLQRRLVSRDFAELPYQAIPVWAMLGAALAFGALHEQWLLATVAGFAYSLVARHRGRLSDAVLAHATSNLLLSAWVLATGRWDLWV
ncbi:MAG TPA: exosortase E/protease, VPEID-CTERM system [Polyangiaceae bacterium]|nr:exosortase E/protease, VPEID-CTERM system [Polyangiaceae bacterium]